MGPGRPFERGNTRGKGRPRGSRNKKTIFQKALERDGEKIIAQIKNQALNCDPTAMKLCMERLMPVVKTPNARFRMPPIETAADLGEAISAVTRAVAEGAISPSEGQAMAGIIESQRRMIETGAFDERLRALEGKQ